ncbi:MAG TPA: type IV toxin-antitoxin system AbiEi family antitoxin [Bacteroidia bacterium]|nr:type IV toxin-antitoxin system AbiEi family antitoxin [Bacteroidia bacterium]
MKSGNLHIRLGDWVNKLISEGEIAFSLKQVKEEFSSQSDIAVKRSLNRLSAKGEIVSIHKGYYLIIPPQYAMRGILPPSMFMDKFMKFLERPYYLGLVNAAAFYGAAHQQPQEFFVFTNFPKLRPTIKKGIKINYLSIQDIPEKLLESRKTETGYLKISSPELTAADVIQYEKRIGGLSRAATILNELTDEMQLEKVNKAFLKEVPITTIQRLGYILEKVLNKKEIADRLYNESQKAKLNFFRTPLKTVAKTKNCQTDERWNVIVNIEIEID